MLTVTAQAAEKLKEVLEEGGQPDAALRVILVSNGQGAQYMLSMEDKIQEDDQVLHENGVKVVVDAYSAPLLEGAEIDYMEGLMRSGFVINNPNIASSGGCGSSGGCACGNGSCGCGAS